DCWRSTFDSGQEFAVRTEDHARNRLGVFRVQRQDFLAASRIQDLHVLAAKAGQALAIRAEREGGREVLESKDFLTTRRIPDLRHSMVAAADEPFAIGTEGHADGIATFGRVT